MPQIKLKAVRDAVLPPPWTAPAGAGPLFTGSGDTDYVCSVCEFVIAASIGSGQRVASIETECPCCGAVNEVITGADLFKMPESLTRPHSSMVNSRR